MKIKDRSGRAHPTVLLAKNLSHQFLAIFVIGKVKQASCMTHARKGYTSSLV